MDNSNEDLEIAHLSKALGWSDPQGLYGYTETSEFKDIYVFFDYGDKTSSVNELATKAFSMYGLGGAMLREKPKWGKIRGSVVIIRLKPDLNFSPNAVHNPNFTLEEIYKTIIFFRDSEVSAYKIALNRDTARVMGVNTGMESMMGMPSFYIGPNGLRTTSQMERTLDQCEVCAKTQAMAGRLKQCTRCKSALYCSRECQKTAWKKHKKICHTL